MTKAVDFDHSGLSGKRMGIAETGGGSGTLGDRHVSRFDRIARLAATMLDAPMALISLNDAEGATLKAVCGLERDTVAGSGTSAFDCAVSSSEVSLVEDASRDERLRDHPLVLNAPFVRFVARVPIVGSAGGPLGSLCVLDIKARRLSEIERKRLIELAAIAADAFELQSHDARSESDTAYLKRSQAQLRTVLNALFAFVGVLEADGTLIDINDPPLRASGLDIGDVRGRPFWDCHWWSYAEHSRDRVRDAVKLAASGQVVRFDAAMQLTEGQLITVDFLIAPLPDATGAITSLVSSAVDISRRVKAEDDLRRTGRIVEGAPFLIRSSTAEGKVLFLNRHGRAVLGYDAGSDLGDVDVAHHHPDWALRLIEKEGYPAAIRDGQWSGETAILGRDGREIPTSHTIVAHRRGDGTIESFTSFAIDISSEKEAEAALKESELRFRGTFENAAVGIAHVGVMGRWLRVNERLLEIVGYERAELVRMTFHEISHPDDLQRDLELFEQLKGGHIESYSLEKRYFHKDGRVIWVEITVSMQESFGGADSYFIVVIEDITERKASDQRQRLLLAELNHRVKNTLATIQSIANQTLRQARDPRRFVARFSSRLQALSAAHDLLTTRTWNGAELAQLLAAEVEINTNVAADRIQFTGPRVLLPPQVALNLALVLHELANNAAEHGALSNATGVLSVSWDVATAPAADDQILKIVWQERGGPSVATPTRNGFGTVLLERGLKQGLAGTYELDWQPDGLIAKLEVPLPTAAFRKDLFVT